MLKIQEYINKLKFNIILFIDVLFDTEGYSMWKKNQDGEWIYYNNEI